MSGLVLLEWIQSVSVLILIEMDSVCVRFSFKYKWIQCVSVLILIEMDSVCVRFSFTRNGFSMC